MTAAVPQFEPQMTKSGRWFVSVKTGNGPDSHIGDFATEAEAKEIGERIRTRVAQVYFAPKGTEDALTIKVGGVVFEKEVDFADMFQSAEQRISDAQDDAGFELKHLHS